MGGRRGDGIIFLVSFFITEIRAEDKMSVLVPTETNTIYEFDKDISAILGNLVSNQLLFITSNSHEFLVNNALSVTSNLPTVLTIEESIHNGTFSNVLKLTSNEMFVYYDAIPYVNGIVSLGKSGMEHDFHKLYTNELLIGTSSCNVRFYKELGQGIGGSVGVGTALVVSSSLYTNKIEVEHANEFLPIGSMMPFGGNILPPGYLWCNGAEVSKTVYSKLYAIIQDMYGQASSPGTHFKLPDFRSRSPFGADTSAFALNPTIASSNYGGTEQVALTLANLPSHDHLFTIKTTGGTVAQGAYGLAQQNFNLPLTDTTKYVVYELDTVGTGTEPEIIDSSVTGFSITSFNTGNGNPFGCVHPVLVTNFIIKY